MWDNYDLLLGDKHQSFLQADSIVFTGYYQACPKYPKNKICNFVAISQKRREEWRNGFDFLHTNKHQSTLQVETINLAGYGQTCLS